MMTDKTEVLLEKEKSWFGTVLKILFFLIAFFAITFTVMFNMGGSSDTLKESVENFISDSFGGRPAHVERLVRMSFFPQVGFDVEGVQVRSYSKGNELLLKADKIKAYMSFWNVLLRKPELTSLVVDNLYAKEGVLGQKNISIEKAYIDHNKDDQTAALRAYGLMDGNPWDFSLGLGVSGRSGKYRYILAKDRPFTVELADLRVAGVMTDKVKDYLRIEDFSATMAGDEIVSGVFSLSVLDRMFLKIRGDLVVGNGKSVLQPEIMIDYSRNPVDITGKVDGSSVLKSDVFGERSLIAMISRMDALVGAGEYDGYDLDLDVNLERIKMDDGDVDGGAVGFQIIREGKTLEISSLKGTISGQDVVLPQCILNAQNGTSFTGFLEEIIGGRVDNISCAPAPENTREENSGVKQDEE